MKGNSHDAELVSGGEFSSSEDCGEGEDDDFKDPNIPSREEQRRIDELLEEQRESRNERLGLPSQEREISPLRSRSAQQIIDELNALSSSGVNTGTNLGTIGDLRIGGRLNGGFPPSGGSITGQQVF